MARAEGKRIGVRLLKVFNQVDRPGDFCSFGAVPPVLPGLEVGGMGPVSLPLTTGQARELIQHCERAGYGKGEETLVDTDVRRVWKLSPSKFTLNNPAWSATLDDIVAAVQSELGLAGHKLNAHLYNLLLYEKGGFFLPHRDGEKQDRMVATLVILLPSAYTGGELVVRSEGHERVIDFSGDAGKFQTHYAAFYADCEHEVRPVRSGFRLCLIYNLTVAKSKASIGAPKSQEQVSQMARLLGDWPAQPDAPTKLAVTLTHQYTQEGLKWDALKGVDRSRALALAEAGRRSGCHVFLALLTLWESASLAYDGSSEYGYGRRRGRHGTREAGDYQIEEMLDTSLTAEHWRSPDGESMPLGSLKILPEEVIPEESLKSVAPKEDVQGYTGNEGLTLDRWYRHAVIVLWPDAHHFDVLCDDDARQAVPLLNKMVSVVEAAGSEAANSHRQRCQAFARTILSRWPQVDQRPWRSDPTASAPNNPLPAIAKLDDENLLRLYLREALVHDVALEATRELPNAILSRGWQTMRPDLIRVLEKTTAASIERNARLLEQLCLAASKLRKNPEAPDARSTCHALADLLIAALVAIDTTTGADAYAAREIDRALLATTISRSLLVTAMEDLFSPFQTHVASRPSQYPLHKVQLPALTALTGCLKTSPASATALRWIEQCTAELESLTAIAPQPPSDYQRSPVVGCKCRLCAQVNQFLVDPLAREYRFQMAEAHRKHLSSAIRYARADLACTTDKRPRPQVLICTKTTDSYQRLQKEYEENCKHLALMRSATAGPDPRQPAEVARDGRSRLKPKADKVEGGAPTCKVRHVT